MIKDSKYFVGFDESKCYIQDLKLGKIVGTSSESGGLYMFDCDHNGKTFAGMSNSGIVSYVSKELWHIRLGHPVDQFEIKVKVIRSDNGTEFVNNKMSDLFTSLGIIHQTSCSYTPRQNSIAERKHKHMLNVARSLMFQRGIPLIDCLNFFDTKCSQSPNDEEGDSSIEDGSARATPIQNEGVVRMSSRPKSQPIRFNDYVVSSNVKYGLEKFVCYSKLSSVKYCFSAVLNKSVKPKYKARLVAQGFGQREGLDYKETFSPVVKMVTVRCLIGLAISKNWPLFQLDVNNAFLYGDLDEEVYMALPLAPKQWNAKLTSALIQNGFIQSKNDYSLYVKSKKGLFVALLVYVNDIVVTGNDLSEIESFLSFLSLKFMIKDLGELKYFLRIEVSKNKNGICLSQRKYCLELLSEYGLLACKPVVTPLQQNTILSFEETENDKFLPSMTEYQKLVGKLIYLFVTRPDIAYDVHCLSQHMHAPLQSHFSAGLRVLRFLKQAPSTGVQFNKGNEFRLHAFSDVDWAKCLKTRKSVSGFYVYFCNNLVSWKSKKQATISRSSAESEYRCLTSTTCEVIWIAKILKDLDIEGLSPVDLYCDSSAAIQIAANPIGSANNVADVLTKELSVTQHVEFCKKLGLVDMFKP
ncbi:ribonuclease H-like domain-containing protein [Tanacetum coccineum]